MSVRLAVNNENQLQEISDPDLVKQSVILRWIAKIISFIFHPVFVPIYVISFMVYIDPYIFAGFSMWNKSIAFSISFLILLTAFSICGMVLYSSCSSAATVTRSSSGAIA